MANIKASESGILGKSYILKGRLERAKELAKQISTDFEGEELIVIGTLGLCAVDVIYGTDGRYGIDFIKMAATAQVLQALESLRLRWIRI